MKKCIVSIFMLCCVVAAAQEPVPLEVWRVNKSNPFRGVYNMLCYVPNFRNGEGKNAIVIRKRSWDDKIDRMETWYNRDVEDTLNQYTWPFGFCPHATPDMNGDGRRDFFNGSTLYLGNEKDEPDTNTRYTLEGNSVGYAKLNNDNSDDIYYYGAGETPNPYMAHFIFGNTTLKTLQKYSLVSTNVLKDSLSYERPKAIYKNKHGKWRLLTGAQGWIKGTYRGIWVAEKSVMRLYSLDFKHINADSTVIIAEQIDEYKDPKWLEHKEDIHSKDPLNWRPLNDAGLLYNTENFPRILYYGSFNTVPDKQTKKYESYATIIDLTEDKISLTKTIIDPFVLLGKVLKHSIDGDNREDIIRQNGDWNTMFISINDNGLPIVRSVFNTESVLSRGRLVIAYSIDDINNDGINDIACLFSNNSIGNALAFIEGKRIISNVIEFDGLKISEPYPLPSNNVLAIPIIVQTGKHYTLALYSQTGKLIHTIFSDELSIGNHIIQFNTSDIIAGTYILRLTDGKYSTDRLIIINH